MFQTTNQQMIKLVKLTKTAIIRMIIPKIKSYSLYYMEVSQNGGTPIAGWVLK
jgi:hypothetical protein